MTIKVSQFKKVLPVFRLLAKPGRESAIKTLDVSGVDGSGVTLQGRDLDHTVTVKAIEADTSVFASLAVNFDKFNKVIGAAGGSDALGFDGGEGLTIEFGKRRITLASAELERCDYGEATKTPGEAWGIQFDADGDGVFSEALDYCALAMSRDETRFHLCGVQFEEDCLVSTDGHRLHKHSGAGIGPEVGGSFLLPAPTVKILQAAIKACGGGRNCMVHCTRTATAGRWVVDGGGISISIVCKMEAVSFPPYKQVIPASNAWASRCLADTKELGAAAKLLKSISDNVDTRGVEVRLNGVLSLHSEGVSEVIGAMDIQGEVVEAGEQGANPSYIVDACKVPSATVMLSLGGGLDPWLLTSGDYLSVVMPMRIK